MRAALIRIDSSEIGVFRNHGGGFASDLVGMVLAAEGVEMGGYAGLCL